MKYSTILLSGSDAHTVVSEPHSGCIVAAKYSKHYMFNTVSPLHSSLLDKRGWSGLFCLLSIPHGEGFSYLLLSFHVYLRGLFLAMLAKKRQSCPMNISAQHARQIPPASGG